MTDGDPPGEPAATSLLRRLLSIPLPHPALIQDWWYHSYDQFTWDDAYRFGKVFEQRMNDVYYVLTGPFVSLLYDLACRGQAKGLNPNWFDSAGLPRDMDDEWDQDLRRGVTELIERVDPARDGAEMAAIGGLESRDWPRRYEQALYRSAIVNSWSAFETLALDLWTGAVDAAAKELGANVLRGLNFPAKRLRDEREAADALAAGHVGTFAAPSLTGKSNVTGIGEYYAIAFGEDPALRAILSRANRALQELAETRHVIVHRAAIVDQAFIKNTGSPLAVGTELLFNPESVGRLVAGAHESGADIVKFVHRWFISNQVFVPPELRH